MLLKKFTPNRWLLIAVINFLIVGGLGLLMRLKLLMPLVWIDQKYLLHAHSHFAFAGWVTHTLMVLILTVFCVQAQNGFSFNWKQQILVLLNIFSAYGMLVTFVTQGYAVYSITFATLNIVVSYVFSIYVWKNFLSSKYFTNQEESMAVNARSWIKWALVFLVLSSIGTLFLSYLMATHNLDSRKQLAAVYFYLHFQYNGWFLFACMGLLHHWLGRQGVFLKRSELLFKVYVGACIPTYFLSVLWWDMPAWLYGIVVIATVAQLMAWCWWMLEMVAGFTRIRERISRLFWGMLLVVSLAFTIKVILQALSLIPELSRYAYGFRPIVIGYLHLVLLLIISVFLLIYILLNRYLKENLLVRAGVIITVLGILVNEVLLVLQGFSGMSRVYIGHIPQLLAMAAGVICLGLMGVITGQFLKKKGYLPFSDR